jgi:hypothetical protein
VSEISVSEQTLGDVGSPTLPLGPPTGGPDKPGSKPDHVKWIGYAIPVSIVLIASLAIFVGYRAERHAGSAAESDQAAISASLNAQRLYTDSLFQAEAAQSNYEQWLSLHQGGFETENPWCSRDSSTVNPAFVEIVVSCELARMLEQANVPGYAPRESFNVSQYAHDVEAASNFSIDTAAQTHVDAADQQRNDERRMLAIGVTLTLALALTTIAQQAYRRQWRPRRRYFSLYLAVPGWATAVVCVALVAMWRA